MKVMKKLCLCILALLLVTVAVFGFTACDEEATEECVHEWGEWETVTPSTCVEAGRERRVCKFDVNEEHVEERDAALAEHTFTVYVSNNDATCTEDGTKTAVCDVDGCGKTHVISDFGSMKSHTFDQKVATDAYLNSPADCDDKATYFYSCACGEKGTKVFENGDYLHTYEEGFTYDEDEHWHACVCSDAECTCLKRSEIEAHEWDEGKVVLEPDCTTDSEGKFVYTCKCGATKEESISIEHSLVRTAHKDSTCQTVGNIEYWQCADCERYYKDAEAKEQIILEATVIPVLNHDFENGVWTFTDETHVKKCANCDVTDAENADEHSLVPMATVDQHWMGCECGYKEGVEDHGLNLKSDAEGHWFECACGFESVKHAHEEAKDAQALNYVAPTCTVNGSAIYKCATCNLAFEKTIPAAHSSLGIHVKAQEPTCTEQGNIEYWQCDACGKYFKDNTAAEEIKLKDISVPELGHDFENGILHRDVVNHYTVCSRCPVIDKESIEAHKFEFAYDETHHFKLCSVCGYKIEEAEHVWDTEGKEVKEPTCDTEGLMVYVCVHGKCVCPHDDCDCPPDRCGATKSEPIPILHKNVKHIEAKAPTCTAEGNKEYWQCEDCERYFSDAKATTETTLEETVIEKTKHDFANGIYTYDEEKHAKLCADCDAVDEFIEHSFSTPKTHDDEMHWVECECGCRKLVSSHVFVAEPLNETEHKLVCECGKTEIVSHTMKAAYVNDVEHKHVCECGYETATVTGGLTKYNDTKQHWYVCGCGYESVKVNHNFKAEYVSDVEHKHVCEWCDYGSDNITGVLEDRYTDEEHWQRCACGYETYAEEHEIVVKYVDGSQHWHECSCGYRSEIIDGKLTFVSDDLGHYEKCDCGYTTVIESHTFETPGYDENQHFKTCECGYKANAENHNYKPVYVNDKLHKHECECGYVTDTFDGALTNEYLGDEHWQKCACGFTTDHEEHDLTFKYNETQHNKECACGYTTTPEEHNYVAAYASENQHKHVCECGYKSEALNGALETKSDDTHHWLECKHSYKADVEEHDLKLKKVDENTHLTACKCGYESTAVAHEYNAVYVSDEKHKHECECGHVTDELDGGLTTESNTDKHWKACEHGYKTDAIDHSYSVKHDESQHWLKCVCGYEIEIEAHSFELKFKDGTGHYEECECGYKKDTVAHELEFKYTNTQHWLKCVCGYEIEIEAHSFELKFEDGTGHYEECECKDRKDTVAHELEFKYTNTQHWLECVCGYATEPVDHGFATKHDDTIHWLECECGCKKNSEAHEIVSVYTPEKEHWHECACDDCDYKTDPIVVELSVDYDETGHWLECEFGYKNNFESHEFTANKDENQHWLECACGYRKDVVDHERFAEYTDYTHWYVCDECGYPSVETEHDFVIVSFNETEHSLKCECGYETTEAHNCKPENIDENNHTPKCECGYSEESVAHDFAATNYDETGHWLECVCGAKKDFADHELTGDSDADNHWNKCECGHTTERISHKLVFGYTDETHSFTCECGYSEESVAHTLKAVHVSDTKHKHECECGYSVTLDGALTLKSDGSAHWYECGCDTVYKTDAVAHELKFKYDENKHYEECECGYKTESVDHSFEPGYDDRQHFTACECGFKNGTAENHSLKLTYINNAKHYAECDNCEYEAEVDHNRRLVIDDNGHSYGCACGHYDIPYTHHEWGEGEITKPATCQTDGERTYTCDCGATKVEVIYANVHAAHKNLKHVAALEATCTSAGRIEYWYCGDCGCYFKDAEFKETVSYEDTFVYVMHDFSESEWFLNENGESHAKKCANCGTFSDWTEHVIKEYCTDDKYHWIGCECGFVRNGEALSEHEFTYAYDGTHHYFSCETCGYISTAEHALVYNANETHHWQECVCGYKTSEAEHRYSHTYNDEMHYEACECGLTRNEVKHNLILTFTPDTHEAACDGCGFKTESAEHEFEIKFNDTEHWHECSCGLIASAEKHSMNTVTEGNYYWTECNCGFKTVSVEKED